MIQIINYSGVTSEKNIEIYKNIKFSKLDNPQSLDEFEINILDLRNELIWRNTGNSTLSINDVNDFRSINKMIQNSVKSKNIILIPQNLTFKYYYSNGKYSKYEQLKDMIGAFQKNILCEINSVFSNLDLIYESTRTKLGQNYVNASFYFNGDYNALTCSVASCKTTTVDYTEGYNVILTTLNLDTYQDIMNFLKETDLIIEKEEVPSWMNNYNMFDDGKQINIISENNDIIKKSQENIDDALKIIEKNNEYKSILYTNGDELVRVVFMILEEMLQCNLSNFKDVKKEDFAVKIDSKHLIGEIKGVTPNVKSENVSQLDVHYQTYLETNNLIEQNIKAVLIVNHQRNKPLENREPVHETQIKLAERNGSLIIETITLLRLLEKFKNDQINPKECLELLFNNKGILNV